MTCPAGSLEDTNIASNTTTKVHSLPDPANLLKTQYGCGPVHFAGTSEALYERHLLFDSGLDPAAATPRDRFEALARSVRDRRPAINSCFHPKRHRNGANVAPLADQVYDGAVPLPYLQVINFETG